MSQLAFASFSYAVTEYKPTYGAVFSEYLGEYTHWSYTDIDIVLGDLALFLDRSELQVLLQLVYAHTHSKVGSGDMFNA